MKIFRNIFIFLGIGFLSFWGVSAGFFDSFITDGVPDVRYCNDDGECGLEEGINVIKDTLTDIETDRTLSAYIQDVVIYVLAFISVVAVIYIMYAGFNILIGNGDEEKVKKSKQTILYVMVGIVIIWLAWPITKLILLLISA